MIVSYGCNIVACTYLGIAVDVGSIVRGLIAIQILLVKWCTVESRVDYLRA